MPEPIRIEALSAHAERAHDGLHANGFRSELPILAGGWKRLADRPPTSPPFSEEPPGANLGASSFFCLKPRDNAPGRVLGSAAVQLYFRA